MGQNPGYPTAQLPSALRVRHDLPVEARVEMEQEFPRMIGGWVNVAMWVWVELKSPCNFTNSVTPMPFLELFGSEQ